MSFNCQNIKHICVINAKNVSKPSWSMVSYKSFWFTKLGLVCSPGLAVSKIFNNFLSLLIPLIDTGQTHCCRCYVTWINVANQITIWGFLLMTYNWLIIAVTSPIWFTKLGLICSPGLTAKNLIQQFSESIDTDWYWANALLPTLRHMNKCGKSDNNMRISAHDLQLTCNCC